MKKLLVIFTAFIFFTSGNSVSIAADTNNPECTITGTSQSETLFGTPGDDVICGMAGNDIIYALDGNDVVLGGDGNDYVDGGSGTDILYGNAGSDILSGSTGADELYGGAGNDGLNGGAGSDILRGEGGVDTCVDFAKDDYLKADCFYDSSLPTIQSVSFASANPKVDSTKGGTSLDLYVKASDLGAGIQSLQVVFAPTSRLREGSTFGADGNLYNATVKCKSLLDQGSPSNVSGEQPVTNCLDSGTPNSGVFKISVRLPANLPKGEYSVWQFRYEDQAHNARLLQWNEVLKQNLQVRFTQIGEADHNAPKLLGAGIIGSRVVHNTTEQLTARIAFKDAGGSALKRFWMSYDLPELGYAKDPGFQQWVNVPDFIQNCDTSSSVLLPCLYSGTKTNGVLQFYLNVDPTWHDLKFLWRAQKLVPKSYSIEDALGNQYQGTLPKALAQAMTYYKGFAGAAPVDDNDVTPPSLVDFVVDKNQVDTGNSSQTITANVTLKDTGAGLNRYGGNVNLELGSPGGASGQCSRVGIASGSNTQATYTFTCVLDAHVAVGKYYFYFNAEDMSLRANTLFIQEAQIVSHGKQVFIQNG